MAFWKVDKGPAEHFIYISVYRSWEISDEMCFHADSAKDQLLVGPVQPSNLGDFCFSPIINQQGIMEFRGKNSNVENQLRR